MKRLQYKAHRVALVLHELYGSPDHDNKPDPLDELVFIVLSQMTTHWSFRRVYDRLKAAVPTWDALLRMPLARVKALIKDAGLSNQKAPRLVAILRRLEADFGRVSLEALLAMTDVEAERYLTTLPGVGVKTARCVLMYSLSRPVLPVDTHVARVARRLGLLPADVPAGAAHEALAAVVPAPDRYAFHVNAVSHGRQVCLALHPRCATCQLRALCAWWSKARAVAAGGPPARTARRPQ